MGRELWTPSQSEMEWADFGVRLQHSSLSEEEFLAHTVRVQAYMIAEIRFIRNILHKRDGLIEETNGESEHTEVI